MWRVFVGIDHSLVANKSLKSRAQAKNDISKVSEMRRIILQSNGKRVQIIRGRAYPAQALKAAEWG
ncbi:hypothetical protein J7337_008044 [Fusarium musae]|uniref:Uncharacterized protein n=1 Tax=Fusarium musae TaxID=1042133 RepID=A0A9P8DD61_9HYPO|nr:hypothetical protein J7337_008044 [Fusarium musae]KAG9499587.1 hypothetical protein J7337_008044 [Fusarium musae]